MEHHSQYYDVKQTQAFMQPLLISTVFAEEFSYM